MTWTLPLEEPKGTDYYAHSRDDLLGRLPQPIGRVLDIGCGAGGNAALLRAAGASWISGIEVAPSAAAAAARLYDEVRAGDALEMVTEVSGPFDTILCYDVLEHLYDPLALARVLVSVSVPGACFARFGYRTRATSHCCGTS